MTTPRVVITGVGAVTPLGLDVDSTWQSALQGVSGAGPITAFDATEFDTRFACQINDFDPEAFLDKRTVRHVDRFAQFALAAAKMAMADAGLEITDELSPEVGVIIGSGIGGLTTSRNRIIS